MIRKATLNDCEDIYQMVCDMEETMLPYDRFYDILKKQINCNDYYTAVFEENAKILGFLNIRFEQQLHHESDIAEVMEIVVKDGSRGKNIGQMLLEKGKSISKEKGCMQLEAACNKVRKDSHRFYQREGMANSHYKFTYKF